MLTGILETIATYEREVGAKPKGITIGYEEFTSLISEYEKIKAIKINDPYSGFYINDVRVDWEK